MTSVLDQLKKTREVLETRGRTIGTLVRSDCRVCLLGAIGVAVLGESYADKPTYAVFDKTVEGFNEEAYAVVESLFPYLPDSYQYEYVAQNYDDVVAFNDTDAEFDDEKVFNLIDRAIAGLEARQ
ncbi:hypothetical protein [Mycobacteroides chelonae]|uniref:DUF6197 family protein n=1 Tax=Mycobacteroides chelonae TaxID=1774 RepID=UPI0004A9F056|nr:hypothetical protein [Mycobacteroides chelonae]OHT67809.1 hypothetical protein BKG66_24605 [Mycobacteroides chelonae]OHT69452.1 hypothetical protein BKG67_23140 [Mycobacteroides chelonae]